MKTQKGLSTVLVIGGILAVLSIVLILAFVNRSTPADVARQALDSAASKALEAKDVAVEKGAEIVAEGSEKAKDAAMEKADEAVDKAVEEGKTMVGEAVKDAGEKMIGESAGSFEDYSAEKITANDGAVLFFHAAWCPTCKALEKDVTANVAEIPAGVAILKTDFDTELDLRKKYGVTLQHTLVQVDASGNEIKSWRGGNTLASVVKNVQ